MPSTIQQLDEYCRLNLYSVIINRKRQVSGFRKNDYPVVIESREKMIKAVENYGSN